MPYMSDTELAEQISHAGHTTELARPAADGDMFGASMMGAAGSMGTAALIGLVRSKLEDPATGEWNVPGTHWDMEACAFLVLSLGATLGQYIGIEGARGYCALGAIGVGSHYMGEVARRFGHTGELSWNTSSPQPQWQAQQSVAAEPSLGQAA
jgi:hypothetical protein